MNEIKNDGSPHGGPNPDGIEHRHPPYWKRAHRDWRFWIAAILVLIAMTIFVLTDNLALRPRALSPPPSDTVGK
jgi:hypothetical protein